MGKAFKLKPYNNNKKKEYQTKIVEKKIEYTKPIKENIKPIGKIYFGFNDNLQPPKINFIIEPSELWDN